MAVSSEIMTGSVVQRGKRCAAGSLWCTTGLGKGVVASVVSCRAGVRGEWGWKRCWRTGTPVHALRALAAGSRRTGWVVVACSVGLGRFWFGELIPWVRVGLAAR
jgi:hypothetical protein